MKHAKQKDPSWRARNSFVLAARCLGTVGVAPKVLGRREGYRSGLPFLSLRWKDRLNEVSICHPEAALHEVRGCRALAGRARGSPVRGCVVLVLRGGDGRPRRRTAWGPGLVVQLRRCSTRP